jgi:hypothetical protein
MEFSLNLQTALACTLLTSLSLFGIRSLHIFAARNGLFEYFLSALDKNRTPSGHVLKVITTNGRFPKLDWQLKAPAVFVLTFTENLAHPDTTLAGFLFLASWAPAWTLIILESFRKCNQGTLAAQCVSQSFSIGSGFDFADRSHLQYTDTRFVHLQPLSRCRYTILSRFTLASGCFSHRDDCRRLEYCTTALSGNRAEFYLRVYRTHYSPRSSGAENRYLQIQTHISWMVPTVESFHCFLSLWILSPYCGQDTI